MAAVVLRRALATATVAGVVMLGTPLVGTAVAATAPAVKAQYPASGAYIVSGGETLSVTYDKQIATNGTFVVTSTSSGGTIAGSAQVVKSSNSPNAVNDTVRWSPGGTLQPGTYTATASVFGVTSTGAADPNARTTTTFGFGVDPRAPQNVSGPAGGFINNVNEKAVPFSGTAAQGVVISVSIYSASDPTGQFPPAASGSATVSPCAGATNCSWSVNVDASNIPDGSYSGVVATTDASKSVGGTVSMSLTKDTSAPLPPNNVSASWADGTDQTLLVSAANGDPNPVTSYTVVVTDPEGHAVSANGFIPDGSGNLNNARVGVGALDDGTVTVTVYAVDNAGNQSQGASPAPNAEPNKVVGIAVDFAGSSLVTPSGSVPLPTAGSRKIQSPTQVAIHLTNASQLTWKDTEPTGTTTHGSQLCIADFNGNCVAFSGSPTQSSDLRTISMTVPAQLPESGGPYSIRVLTYDKNECPDFTPLSMNWTCYSTSGSFSSPGAAKSAAYITDTSGQKFTFNVDNTPPTVAFTGFSPAVVTQATAHQVSVTGTTSADTKTLQLVIKSSAGGSPLLVNVPLPTPASGASTVSWSVSNLDLSNMRDGSLSVTANATDQAGNVAAPLALVPAPTLAAHLSWLTEFTSSRQVTYGKLIRLNGRLTDNSGAAIPNAPLTVKPQFDNGTFGRALSATTDATGNWSLLVAPGQNATYWASYAGTNSAGFHDPVTVHTARTLVAVRIGFLSPRYGAKVGSPVILKGQVSPNKAGKYVYFYRHTKTRNIFIGRAKLGRGSRWAFALKLRRGTTYVFAKIGNTYGNRGNRTGYLKLRH